MFRQKKKNRLTDNDVDPGSYVVEIQPYNSPELYHNFQYRIWRDGMLIYPEETRDEKSLFGRELGIPDQGWEGTDRSREACQKSAKYKIQTYRRKHGLTVEQQMANNEGTTFHPVAGREANTHALELKIERLERELKLNAEGD